MSRYCSIVTRQKLSRSIKSSLNFEEQEIIKSSLLKKNSSNFWNKILKSATQFETKNAIRIISNKDHHTNNKVDEFQIISHRILCEEIQKLYNNFQEQISQKQRNLSPRLIRKDIQKFCNNLHKQVSQKQQQVLSKFEEAVSARNDSKTITVSIENEELLDQFNVLRKSNSASLNLGGYGSLGTFISILQSGKMQQANKKSFGTNYLHTEIKKYCNHIQEKISQARPRLWTATPLATVTVNSSTSKMENATNIESKPEIVIEPIPEPPVIPEALGGTEEVLSQVNALGEPTFASLGLGGYSPVGIVQHCFEYLHGTLGLEWWLAIALGTLVVRTILFPLVIMAQRNAAKMNNYLPQMQILQLKMTEARQTGNQMDAARYSQELMLFMKEKGVNPLKNMVVPLAQMPIFISFFMGLRQMANVPVDSLRTGGILWFTDLTLPDQYFLMPIITSATLYATIELGTDTAKLSSQNMQLMKYVLRGLPLIILPFTFNFPGAILCYWVSSNFISLAQVGFLRIPAVRDYFKIEPMQKFSVDQMPLKPKGFREGLKDSWENMKITKQLEERKRLDELAFQRAGKGPIVKTYKYDPTKQTEPDKSAPVSVKST